MRIVCVGDCGIDRYPAADRPGGCTLHLAGSLARHAAPGTLVQVVSAVGDDPEGDAVRRALRALPVEAHVARLRGATSVQRLSIDERGERHFTGYTGGVLETFIPGPAANALIAGADAVATVVYTQIEPLFEAVLAVPRRGWLAADFMTLEDYGRDLARIDPWLARVDVAFFGLASTDRDLLSGLASRAAASGKTFVVTLGPAGAVAFTADRPLEVPAVPVERVGDTTGAGDVFAGAFLAEKLAGAGLRAALDRGALAAANHIKFKK